MQKIRVGVLRGGAQNYETSLKTGDMVVKHLPDHYYTEDIFITQDGRWLKDGLEIRPHNAISNLDVVFNALHGPSQDNEHVQHLLEYHKVPFTGTGTFASVITQHPFHMRQLLSKGGARPIPYRLVEIPSEGVGEELSSLFSTFPAPLIVRPVGIQTGVLMAHNYDEFVEMMEEAFKVANQILLEEYIPGSIVSVGVIEGYRDHDMYTLPVASSAPLAFEAKKELENMARKVHDILGMRHYSRTDFLVSPSRGFYVAQVIPHPSFHEESVLHKALQGVGAPVSHFLNHVVQLALNKK